MKIGLQSYPRDKTAKLVIRFEAGPLFSRGYFLKYSHFAIAAKLHCPKGDWINESLLYMYVRMKRTYNI